MMNNTLTVEKIIPSVVVNADTIDRVYKDAMLDIIQKITQGPRDKIKDFLYRFEVEEETPDNYILRVRISIYSVTQTEVSIKPTLPPKKCFFERLGIGIKYIFGGRNAI